MISRDYEVKRIQEDEIEIAYQLCKGNPQYYEACPPFVSLESIKQDMISLPPGKISEDKYYLGYWKEGSLVAILDLIMEYPNKETAYIGFFMMDQSIQCLGIGSKLIIELLNYLSKSFQFVQLGYILGNHQSEWFWLKNGFKKTGEIKKAELYEIVIMEINLLEG